jgi:hypothetical protein
MSQTHTITITQEGFFKHPIHVENLTVNVAPGDTLNIVYESKNTPTRQLGVLIIPFQPSPFVEEPSPIEGQLPLTWWYSQTRLTVSTDALVKGKRFGIQPPGNKGGQGKSGTLVVSG